MSYILMNRGNLDSNPTQPLCSLDYLGFFSISLPSLLDRVLERMKWCVSVGKREIGSLGENVIIIILSKEKKKKEKVTFWSLSRSRGR